MRNAGGGEVQDWRDNPELFGMFREETHELLHELESGLLALEKSPDDTGLVDRVFRALHTIKGSGGMFGFDDISSFAHEVETVFDLVRDGEVEVTKELTDIGLSAKDVIRSMLDSFASGETVDMAERERLVLAIRGFMPADRMEVAGEVQSAIPREISGEPNVTYRIRFRPSRDTFKRGVNPLLLLEELKGLGESRVFAQTERIEGLEIIDPEQCSTYWDVILTTSQGINAIRDVFIFVEEDAEIRIDVIDQEGVLADEEGYRKLGEILVERGDLHDEDVQRVISEQKRLGELLVNAGLVDEGKVESALGEQDHVKESRKRQKTEEASSSIRVASDKLDNLVDLVGELVTVQARLSRVADLRDDSDLVLIAEAVERLTSELRDSTMGIRMVPIGSMFSRFRRLVRDLSKELGKDVEMITLGAETELDKTLIEKLNDPLIHLIRNTIDHGIELPVDRRAAGKLSRGTVHLSAAHSGPNVIIQIGDDGAGIDPDVVKEKAVEKGLLQQGAELAEKEVLNLLFMPGFSTARKVTSVSGRGVGMDVVKKAIESLRGSIEISSTKGEGTTILLTLPLTLAIIEGLLVRISSEFFVIPLSLVEECIELTRSDAERSHGRHLVRVREELIPYIRLREKFAVTGEPPDIEQVVVTVVDGSRVGFTVDEVIGQHQTVIKTLGRFYRSTEGISGATILGDGTVALILDVPELVRITEIDEADATERVLEK